MEKTRAFICIDFPDEIIKEIARIQNLLQNKKFIGKLTELRNLHLTLKFLGEIDNKTLGKIKEKLDTIKIKEFEAKLDGTGTFFYHNKPRIVWIKIRGKELFNLQTQVDEALSEMFEKEQRFMSHLTIARIKYVKDKKAFKDHVKHLAVKPIKFQVNNFKLMSSELTPTGPVYTTLKRYNLQQLSI